MILTKLTDCNLNFGFVVCFFLPNFVAAWEYPKQRNNMREIQYREALREAMQEEMRRDDTVFLM